MNSLLIKDNNKKYKKIFHLRIKVLNKEFLKKIKCWNKMNNFLNNNKNNNNNNLKMI